MGIWKERDCQKEIRNILKANIYMKTLLVFCFCYIAQVRALQFSGLPYPLIYHVIVWVVLPKPSDDLPHIEGEWEIHKQCLYKKFSLPKLSYLNQEIHSKYKFPFPTPHRRPPENSASHLLHWLQLPAEHQLTRQKSWQRTLLFLTHSLSFCIAVREVNSLPQWTWQSSDVPSHYIETVE